MDISQYFIDHFIMLTELVGLSILLRVGVHVSKRSINATLTAIVLIIIESVMWSLESWTQDNPGHEMLRAILTSCIYGIHPIIVVAFIFMTTPIEKHKMMLFIPLFIYIPIVLTSQWTHIIFFIDRSNRWHGNGNILSYVPYIIFLAYVFVFIALFTRRFIKYSWRTLIGVVYFIAICILGVVLNLTKDTGTDYSTLFASVIVLYYLFMYMHVSRTDNMTGLFNRQTFYNDSKRIRKRLTAICSVDMNELKWINDTQGHKAGDAAIEKVAESIAHNAGHYKLVYRTGGDEFMILYSEKSSEEIEQDIAEMREILSATEFSCAFGFTMINGETEFEAALHDADKAMYKDKAEVKRAILAAGGQLHKRTDDF